MTEFYKVIPGRNGTYRVTSLEGVFCELLVGKEKAMLIDTGHGFGNLRGVVESVIGDKPLYIVNTHGHLDHVCGNAQFDVPVYIGAEDMELCRVHTSRFMRLRAAGDAEHAMDWTQGKEVYGLPDGFDPQWYAGLGSGRLTACAQDDVFELGDMTVRVLETPGHTQGGRSFYHQQADTLYVGDAANPFLWLFAPEATNRATHIATLDKMLALSPQHVYGGHNPISMTCDDLARFRQVAIEADYEKGLPFKGPMDDGIEARICCLKGMTPEDLGKPGFASIIIDSSR